MGGNLRSRLHFGHNREGNHEVHKGHVVALGKTYLRVIYYISLFSILKCFWQTFLSSQKEITHLLIYSLVPNFIDIRLIDDSQSLYSWYRPQQTKSCADLVKSLQDAQLKVLMLLQQK
jgi:hypothetical protein